GRRSGLSGNGPLGSPVRWGLLRQPQTPPGLDLAWMGELPAIMLSPALVELEDLPVTLAVPQVSFGDVPQAFAFPYDMDPRVLRLRLLRVRRHPDHPAGPDPAVGGEGGSVRH